MDSAAAERGRAAPALAELSQTERDRAAARFAILRPHLEEASLIGRVPNHRCVIPRQADPGSGRVDHGTGVALPYPITTRRG
jgi:hypothetical protein